MIRNHNNSYVEQVFEWIQNWLKENKLPFFATIVIGLLSHMFAFANKFVNHDEIWSLFQKGATVGSGRWGLELVTAIFPNYSMPWIYGVISLVLIAASVCLMISVFSIKSKTCQLLLGGLVVSFPSLTGTFCYMFTSTSYALAFYCAVMAVWLVNAGGWKRIAKAMLLAVFSLSIYQAYIAIIASFFVLLLVIRLLWKDSSVKCIIISGVNMVAFLLAVLAIYYVSVVVSLRISGQELNSYANNNFQLVSINLLRRLYVICVNIMYLFTRRNWDLINSSVSLVAHLALIAILIWQVLRTKRDLPKAAMLFFLAAMLILAINCMYLIAEEDATHTLVLYSYITVYIFALKLIEEYLDKKVRVKDFALISLLVIMICNIYYANITYLQMNIVCENGYAFFSSVVTQVKQTPGFDSQKKLALIGEGDNWIYDLEEFGDNKIRGTDPSLVNVISRDEFIKYYIGFDIPFATEDEIMQIEKTQEYQDMEEYPWYGSVAIIDDYVVVKLGTED